MASLVSGLRFSSLLRHDCLPAKLANTIRIEINVAAVVANRVVRKEATGRRIEMAAAEVEFRRFLIAEVHFPSNLLTRVGRRA